MRYLPVICAGVGGLICGAALALLGVRDKTDLVSLEPRTESISFLEDEVTSVIFRDEQMTFAAQRSRPGAAFAVQVTYADGKPSQQCRVSSSLGGRLAAYSTLTTKRQLASQPQAQADFPVTLGTLELRDRMLNEPTTTVQLRGSAGRKTVVALYQNVAAEVTAPASAFTRLEQACDFLSGPTRP